MERYYKTKDDYTVLARFTTKRWYTSYEWRIRVAAAGIDEYILEKRRIGDAYPGGWGGSCGHINIHAPEINKIIKALEIVKKSSMPIYKKRLRKRNELLKAERRKDEKRIKCSR